MPIHVMHLIETLGSGGAERLLFTNLKNLDSSRFQSTVVTVFSHGTQWLEPIKKLGVNVISLDCKSQRSLVTGVARLYRVLRKAHPDLLHTHLWTANVIGRLAGRIARVPVLSSIHGMEFDPVTDNYLSMSPRKIRLMRSLDRWTAHTGGTRLLAVSDYIRRSVNRHMNVPLDSISLIRNPIDLDALQAPPQRKREELLKELGLPLDSQILLNVGRFSPQKGLGNAIRALAILKERHPGVQLLSVGSTDNQEWLQTLRSEAEFLGVADRLHVIGPRLDVFDLLRACDVFVFPSLHEGFGIALVEAMAVGCACVATDVGPLPELIKNGVTGVLVPVGDVPGLEKAISELLSNPGYRNSLGEAARSFVSNEFRPEPASAQLSEIYESMVKS